MTDRKPWVILCVHRWDFLLGSHRADGAARGRAQQTSKSRTGKRITMLVQYSPEVRHHEDRAWVMFACIAFLHRGERGETKSRISTEDNVAWLRDKRSPLSGCRQRTRRFDPERSIGGPGPSVRNLRRRRACSTGSTTRLSDIRARAKAVDGAAHACRYRSQDLRGATSTMLEAVAGSRQVAETGFSNKGVRYDCPRTASRCSPGSWPSPLPQPKA